MSPKLRLVLGVILVVHVNAELTIEGESSVAKRLVGLCSNGRPRSRVHQDSWPVDDFRLIGMKNRNVVEGAIERSCCLTRHQGDIRLSAALKPELETRKRDAGQDQYWESPETHEVCCCGVRMDVDNRVLMLSIHNVVTPSETANRLMSRSALKNPSA